MINPLPPQQEGEANKINELNNMLLNSYKMNCSAIGIENYDTFFPSNFDNVINFYFHTFNDATIADNLTKRLQYLITKMPVLNDSTSPYLENWAKILRIINFLAKNKKTTDEIMEKLIDNNQNIFNEDTLFVTYFKKRYPNII